MFFHYLQQMLLWCCGLFWEIHFASSQCLHSLFIWNLVSISTAPKTPQHAGWGERGAELSIFHAWSVWAGGSGDKNYPSIIFLKEDFKHVPIVDVIFASKTPLIICKSNHSLMLWLLKIWHWKVKLLIFVNFCWAFC